MFERLAPAQEVDAAAWQANYDTKRKEAARCRARATSWLFAAAVSFIALVSFLIPVLDGSGNDLQNIGFWVSFVLEVGCIIASRLYSKKFDQAVRDGLNGTSSPSKQP